MQQMGYHYPEVRHKRTVEMQDRIAMSLAPSETTMHTETLNR